MNTTNNVWHDFNDADAQQGGFEVIPKGTLARVRMTLKPGGHDDPAQGWTGGYATRGTTGSVYLSGEFTVLEGPYARRKIFTLIGLYSPKGPDWANMGRSMIRGMLNSARGISDKDMSAEAQAARRISGFADLDGLEFAAFVDVQKPTQEQIAQGYGNDRNVIQNVIPATHKDYVALMSGQGASEPAASAPTPAASKPVGNMPAWAS